MISSFLPSFLLLSTPLLPVVSAALSRVHPRTKILQRSHFPPCSSLYATCQPPSHVHARPADAGPSSPRPTVAVVGSGAIGCYYGARLHAGRAHEVRFLIRDAQLGACATDGLTVQVRRPCARRTRPPSRRALSTAVRVRPRVPAHIRSPSWATCTCPPDPVASSPPPPE